MQTKIFAPALIAAALAGAAFAADKPVAVVNGVAIPQSQMDFILKQQAEAGAKDTPDIRAKIRDFLVTNEVLAQEAAKKGLAKDPDVVAATQLSQQEVLVKAYLQNYQKTNVIADEVLKGEYDKWKATMPSKEYKARHILVATEKEATDVLAALKKGKKFDDLAKEKSKDTGSAASGGDLGWNVPGGYVKEFGDALAKMTKGQITPTPVKTQFGFHIIKLDDVRTPQGPSFEEVKGTIQQQMQNQEINKLVADLRAKAKVE